MIVVVALVIGPFVIGAVGAAAGALGASAAAASAIGAVVGGAIVGAGTSAVIQMGSNLIDGKPVLEGVVQALVVGAIGGALGGLGGLAGQGLVNTLRVSSGFAQGAIKFGVDMAFDTVGGILGNLATGQPLTLDGLVQGFLSGAAVSLSMGGLGKLGRFGQGIAGIQQRSMAAGEAFGGSIPTVRPSTGIDIPTSTARPDVDMPSTTARPDIDTPNTTARPDIDTPNTTPRGPDIDTPSTTARPDIDTPNTTPRGPDIDTPSTAPRGPDLDAPNTTPRGPDIDTPNTTPRGPDLDAPDTTPRSTHQGEPEVSPGVVAKQDVEGGHQVKVLKDGRVVVCSTCGELRTQYAAELSADPKLKADLDRIEAIPDPKTKAEEAAQLRNQLEQTRQNSPNSTDSGAQMAREAGLPNPPDGYHWKKEGNGVILRRNPDQADSLVPLRYDENSPTKFTPDISPPARYEWQPAPGGGYTLVPTAPNMPPIKYDPAKQAFIDTNSGKLFVPPELAGGNWANHSYGDPSVVPCFVPGTPVKTPSGDRAIETLQQGDLVFAYDLDQRQMVQSLITQVYISQTSYLVDVQVAGEVIQATRQHPFWVESLSDWISAANLAPGMSIRLLNGSFATIDAVDVYPSSSPTYNLEVAQTHTYFVGASGVLVHNGSDGESDFSNTTPHPGRLPWAISHQPRCSPGRSAVGVAPSCAALGLSQEPAGEAPHLPGAQSFPEPARVI